MVWCFSGLQKVFLTRVRNFIDKIQAIHSFQLWPHAQSGAGHLSVVAKIFNRIRENLANYIVFCALSIVGLVWLTQASDTVFVIAFERLLAQTAALLLQLLSIPTEISANQLSDPTNSNFVTVDYSCTALEISLFIALFSLICLRSSWRNRILTLFFWVLFLQILNVLRISHLFYLKVYAPQLFDLFHLIIWQAVNFLILLLLVIKLMTKAAATQAAQTNFKVSKVFEFTILSGLVFSYGCGGGGGGGGGGSGVPYFSEGQEVIMLLLFIACCLYQSRNPNCELFKSS